MERHLGMIVPYMADHLTTKPPQIEPAHDLILPARTPSATVFFDSHPPPRLRGFAQGFAPGAVKAALRFAPAPLAVSPAFRAPLRSACAAWVIPLGQLRPVTLPPHSHRRAPPGVAAATTRIPKGRPKLRIPGHVNQR